MNLAGPVSAARITARFLEGNGPEGMRWALVEIDGMLPGGLYVHQASKYAQYSGDFCGAGLYGPRSLKSTRSACTTIRWLEL